jgi:hypothetical protein
MNDPDNEDIRGTRRRSVLEQDQAESPLRTAPYRRGKRSSSLPGKLIPLLFLLVFGVIIAHNEIPAFAQWWERLVAPQDWEAKQQCQVAALSGASNPAFARIIKPGQVHRTSEGVYVDKLVLGEMGEEGAEQAVEYSCYLDSAGNLVQLNRL